MTPALDAETLAAYASCLRARPVWTYATPEPQPPARSEDWMRGRRDAVRQRVNRREYARPGDYREGVRSWTM